MKDIVIFGASGFGKEIACLLNSINVIDKQWNFLGFYDDFYEVGTKVSHFGEILGGLNDLNSVNNSLNVVIALGDSELRKSIYEKILNENIIFPNICHPGFSIDEISVKMGIGNVITHEKTLSCDIEIGDFNMFNSKSASVGHDVKIGSFNSFMPMTAISGNVNVGDCNYFGVNAVVLPKVKIGNNTKISSGSVVYRNTKDNTLYMGNPAKKFNY